MKRCILVDSRISKDEKTGDTFLNMTCYMLASKMKDGHLWHHQSSKAIITTCVKKESNPDKFQKYSVLLPGTLVDIAFDYNEFTGKPVARIDNYVQGTNIFNEKQLYV